MITAPRALVSYPPRPLSLARLGYNLGNLTNATIDFGIAGGASLFRNQFGWNNVEKYQTGVLSLTTAQTAALSYMASQGVEPVIVAGYGPPYITIGQLTIAENVPSATPAGTPISVASYAFPITYPLCFIGAVDGPIGRASYYGGLITSATPNSVALAAATIEPIASGTVFPIQQLAYAPPSSDADPSIAAFVRYATFLADEIARAGAKGGVCIWNEWLWDHDTWDSLANFYDSPPKSITTTTRMKAILTQCQQAVLG